MTIGAAAERSMSAGLFLVSLLPHAVTRDLEGAGHFIQEDAPGDIALAIREWCAQLPRTAHDR